MQETLNAAVISNECNVAIHVQHQADMYINILEKCLHMNDLQLQDIVRGDPGSRSGPFMHLV